MKEVTLFESEDGVAWRSQTQAVERDAEIRFVKELQSIVGPRVPSLRGWVQRDVNKVAALRKALVAVAEKLHPAEWWSKHTAEDLVCPTSLPSRIMSETSGPLSDLWWRVACIDSSGREWEQAYWLGHQDEGLKQYPREYREGD